MSKTKTQIKLKVRIPRIVLDARDAKPEILETMAAGFEELGARFRVLGKAPQGMVESFSTEEAVEEANIWVILSDELPKDFDLIVQRGIIPVMLQGLHPKAENYVPSQERGNSFLFPKLTPWYAYGAMVRAIENFGFSYDWQNLKNQSKIFIAD